jgi:AcrR family transcriptional regulator
MSDGTRERIVRAAMELFSRQGYQATSVQSILAASDVNAGSLYHFFPGKQDVLIAVLETYRDNMSSMLLEPAWQGIADPLEKVFALLARYRDLVDMSDAAYGCPIGSLALELSEPDPSVRRLLAQNFDRWTAAVRACFEEAGARLPATTDRAALAEFVLTTMEGAVMQARTHRDVGYFDRAVGELRRYLGLLQARTTKVRPAARGARRR